MLHDVDIRVDDNTFCIVLTLDMTREQLEAIIAFYTQPLQGCTCSRQQRYSFFLPKQTSHHKNNQRNKNKRNHQRHNAANQLLIVLLLVCCCDLILHARLSLCSQLFHRHACTIGHDNRRHGPIDSVDSFFARPSHKSRARAARQRDANNQDWCQGGCQQQHKQHHHRTRGQAPPTARMSQTCSCRRYTCCGTATCVMRSREFLSSGVM